MPKSKKKKVSKRKNPSLFEQHKNLKWLLSLLALSVLAFLFIKHRVNDYDPSGDRSAVIKQQVQDKLHIDKEVQDNVSPTPSPRK